MRAMSRRSRSIDHSGLGSEGARSAGGRTGRRSSSPPAGWRTHGAFAISAAFPSWASACLHAAVAVASIAASACALAGCESGTTLYVDVRTDLVPGREFVSVRTEVSSMEITAGTSSISRVTPAMRGEDFLRGVRVAEVQGLPGGTSYVRATLLGAGGVPIVERDVIVTGQGAVAVTVVLTRDCRGVECGTDTTCASGRCVPRSCGGSADRTSCGDPRCTLDEQCSVPTSCGAPHCFEATCFVVLDDRACPAGQACTEEGCVGEPGDAGWDAGLDGSSTVLDGCACAPGTACTTACGSTGITRCDGACVASCDPVAETCNLVDDDCNGRCDDGVGCRQAMVETRNALGSFCYATDPESQCPGHTVFGVRFHAYRDYVAGTVPLYRCLDADASILLTRVACRPDAEPVAYVTSGGDACGAGPIHHFRKREGLSPMEHIYLDEAPPSGDPLYSSYEYRGVAFHAWREP